MTLVKLILDIKDSAWISANPTKLLRLNEPIYRNDGFVAFGDGVTPLSGLTFKPVFTGAVNSVNGQTGDVEVNEVPNGGTTGQVLAKASDTDNDTEWIDVTASGGLGYSMQFVHYPTAYADSKSYVIGFQPIYDAFDLSLGNGWAGALGIFPPKDGTIKTVSFGTHAYGATGSAQNATVKLNVYNSSNVLQSSTTLSSTVLFTDSFLTSYSFTGLNIAISLGQYFVIILETPAWVANPTQAWIQGAAYIE